MRQAIIEVAGLAILIYVVGVVIISIFAKEPDDEVDIRDTSRSRIHEHRISISKSTKDQSNVSNHRRR